jgi:hypothetical protein
MANAKTATERTQTHRQKMKALGMRPIQIWVPDTRSKKFLAEARRQSLAARNDPHEKETMDWLDQVRDTRGWEWSAKAKGAKAKKD